MRKIVFYAIFLPVAVFALIHSSPLWSAPREVILYPHAAYVTEVAKMRLQPAGPDQKKAIFHLPAEADPQSLAVGFEHPARMQIDSIRQRPIIPDDDDSLKALRSRHKKTQDERGDLMAQIKALDAQIQFWQAQTKGKVKNAAEAAATSSALGKNVRILYREKIFREADLEKADYRIAEQIQEIDRRVKGKRPFSEITLLISGAQGGEAVIKYSYLTDGCGWTPRRRIEANTQTGQVIVKEQIEIRQDSSNDWKQVALRIAAGRPVNADSPDQGQPSSPAQPVPLPRTREATGKPAQRKSAAPSAKAVPVLNTDSASADSSSGGFSIDLGVLDVPARSSRWATLKNDAYPADFVYLLRPALSPHAAVMASIKQPIALRFPAAEALLSINGTVMGNKVVSFTERSENIYIGEDHHVTVDRRLLKESSSAASEAGKTAAPLIVMEIKNTKPTSVKIVVEEPVAQSPEGKTAGHDPFDPPPSDRDGLKALWRFELPAGGTKTISVF